MYFLNVKLLVMY